MVMSSRLDKYLWSVRLFKKRSEAAEACKGGRIKVDGFAAKAAKEISIGALIEFRKGVVNYRYEVVDIPKSRLSAKLVENYLRNLTPQEELEKLNIPKESLFLHRERGSGRPTKKERRDIDRLLS